jgi:hypothetical membrane protein
MIYVAIVLFALSAVLGLVVLINWLGKKEAPKSVVYSHGIVAASALVILIVYALNNPADFPKVSLILFVIAAIGGLYLFFKDQVKNQHPTAVAFVHALLAISGFISLLVFIFG